MYYLVGFHTILKKLPLKNRRFFNLKILKKTSTPKNVEVEGEDKEHLRSVTNSSSNSQNFGG